MKVLILIVVDDGLVQAKKALLCNHSWIVLILIVVDDGLVHINDDARAEAALSLNPYCSGRWSRTYLC